MAIKKVKGLPITGATPQNSPVANVYSNQSDTSRNAEQMIKRPPMPFQSRQGPANIPAPSNTRAAMAAKPKGRMSLSMPRGMQKHNAPSVDAHPLYGASPARHSFAAVGGGQTRSGKGAPAVMNGKVGLLGASFKRTSQGSGKTGAPQVKRGKGGFFGG